VQSPEEKERYASSIIRVLDSETDLSMSTANARASVFLAEVLFVTKRYQDSINEAIKSINRLTSTSNQNEMNPSQCTLLTRAYRVLADVHEQNGNYTAAIESVQAMASYNPAMRTKVTKEVERLRLLALQ
jgi:hypothetical protein